MTYVSEVLADTPLLFWELNDNGATAADSSGNGHTGTYSGGYTQLQAPLVADSNYSVLFNGSTSKVTSGSGLSFSGDFTVEFWTYLTPSAGYAQTDNYGVYGGAAKVRLDARPGWAFFGVWIGGTEATIQTNNGNDSHVNKTVYWTFQRTGTTLNMYTAIVGADSAPVLQGQTTGVATTTVDLSGVLGSEENSPNSFFKGYIDEFAIYQSALSTARMGAHYTAGITTFSQTGPLAPVWPRIRFNG